MPNKMLEANVLIEKIKDCSTGSISVALQINVIRRLIKKFDEKFKVDGGIETIENLPSHGTHAPYKTYKS